MRIGLSVYSDFIGLDMKLHFFSRDPRRFENSAEHKFKIES